MLRKKKSPERPVPPAVVEKFFLLVFRLINKLDRGRRDHPRYTDLALGVVSLGIAHVVWSSLLEPLAVHFGLSGNRLFDLYHLAVAASHLAGAFLSFLVLRAFIPLVLVSQRAMAIEALGLTWVSVTGDIHSLLSWFLRWHSESERIKVICMSGETLFSAETLPDGRETPLRPWATRGKLDVLMPVSSKANPTVSERFKRYSPQLKASIYRSVDDLLNEINRSKAFLDSHEDNTRTEHNILCMWRVVILKDACLVQNYFPNVDGLQSDFAPVFVYKNTGNSDSYYHMYSEMFDLIKKHALSAGTTHSGSALNASQTPSRKSRRKKKRASAV